MVAANFAQVEADALIATAAHVRDPGNAGVSPAFLFTGASHPCAGETPAFPGSRANAAVG